MPECSLEECWITSTGHMIEIQRVTHVKHYSNSAVDWLVNPGPRHFGSRRSKRKKEEIKIKNGAQGTRDIEGSEPDWH